MHYTFTELELYTGFFYIMINTFIIEQDLQAVIIATDIFIYVPTHCTVWLEEQCSHIIQSIHYILVKK